MRTALLSPQVPKSLQTEKEKNEDIRFEMEMPDWNQIISL